MDLKYIVHLYLLPHKGPTCMPNTFAHISYGFCFKNKVDFCIMYHNPRICQHVSSSILNSNKNCSKNISSHNPMCFL